LGSLERVFALEGPDEPDLGLNVSYLTSCRALSRLALAEPWEVPRQTVEPIRRALAMIEEMRDPHELESQLLSFPAWVLRVLERRGVERAAAGPGPQRRAAAGPGPQRRAAAGPGPQRRVGDRLRPAPSPVLEPWI
jgi:hypothetical protein